MSLMTEQHISAQVWTCTRCGGEDPKSCGCSAATATSREIQVAKKEAHRQAVNRSAAKKREKNQGSADNLSSVENTRESRAPVTVTEPPENIETLMPRLEDEAYFQDEYDEVGNYTGYTYTPMDERADAARRVRGLIFRAMRSKFAAEADSLKNLPCTKEMLEAVDAVISGWTKVRTKVLQQMSSMAVR